MQLYHKEHIIFFKTPLRLTEPLRELPESHFSALDKKNNLLQFKNVLTPERRGYKGTLLKFTPRLPLQLHYSNDMIPQMVRLFLPVFPLL